MSKQIVVHYIMEVLVRSEKKQTSCHMQQDGWLSQVIMLSGRSQIKNTVHFTTPWIRHSAKEEIVGTEIRVMVTKGVVWVDYVVALGTCGLGKALVLGRTISLLKISF